MKISNRNLIITIFLTVISFSISFSQKIDNTQGIVEYKYTMRTVGLEEMYVLKFNKHETVYLHHQEARSYTSTQGYEVFSPRKIYDWYLDSKKKQVTEQEKLKDGNLVYASFDAIPIEWELQNETKTMLGYTVQKAVAKNHHFVKGKGNIDYGDAIAWFAIDLPFPSGPERFWGLPGLILEISFTGFVGVYSAAKITFEPVSNLMPNQGKKITKEELYKNKPWLGKARDLLNSN